MNIQKFTQKSVEAINACEKLAYDYGNQEIEQEHLLVALMQQEDGLIPKLIEKMDIQRQHFEDNALRKLEARVKVSGGQIYVDSSLISAKVEREDVEVFYIPATQMAKDNGIATLANMIIVGSLLRHNPELSFDGADEAVNKLVPPKKAALIELNKKALALGKEYGV